MRWVLLKVQRWAVDALVRANRVGPEDPEVSFAVYRTNRVRQKRVLNDASEYASLRKRIEALRDQSVLETVSLHSAQFFQLYILHWNFIRGFHFKARPTKDPFCKRSRTIVWTNGRKLSLCSMKLSAKELHSSPPSFLLISGSLPLHHHDQIFPHRHTHTRGKKEVQRNIACPLKRARVSPALLGIT